MASGRELVVKRTGYLRKTIDSYALLRGLAIS